MKAAAILGLGAPRSGRRLANPAERVAGGVGLGLRGRAAGWRIVWGVSQKVGLWGSVVGPGGLGLRGRAVDWEIVRDVSQKVKV